MKKWFYSCLLSAIAASAFAQTPQSEKPAKGAVQHAKRFEISLGLGTMFLPKVAMQGRGAELPIPATRNTIEFRGNIGVTCYPWQRLGIGLQSDYLSYKTVRKYRNGHPGFFLTNKFISTSVRFDYCQPLGRNSLYVGSRLGMALQPGIDESRLEGIRAKYSVIADVHAGYKMMAVKDQMWAFIEIGRSFHQIREPQFTPSYSSWGRPEYLLTAWPTVLGVSYRI